MRSTTCEREYVEGQKHDFLSLVLTERYVVSVVRRKREVRRGLSYFYHGFLLLRFELLTSI